MAKIAALLGLFVALFSVCADRSNLDYSGRVLYGHSLRGSHAADCKDNPPPIDYTDTIAAVGSYKTSECSAELHNDGLKNFELTIAFTADIHGHVEALPQVSHMVRELRSHSRKVLLVDCGDISIGTAFAKHHGAASVSEVMELVGYQAIALGNHDLEYAHALPKHIPLLSANVPGYLPSKVIEIGGVHVALLAYTMTDDLTHSSTVLEAAILDRAVCLRRAGADVVILLGHGLSSINRRIAAQSQHIIDAILGGHTHELLGCTDGRPAGPNTAVLHPGAAGEYLGLFHISRQAQKTSYHARMAPITPNLPADPKITQWLAPKLAALITDNHVLASVTTTIQETDNACRTGECITGRVVTDAIRWHFNCTAIALFEAGSIRDVLRENITETLLVETLPWDNKVVLYEIAGDKLISMLQRSARAALQGSGEAFLHMSGMKYDGDSAATAPVRRRTSYAIHSSANNSTRASNNIAAALHHGICNGAQIASPQKDQRYVIAVTDWVAGGGDGYGDYLSSATQLPRHLQSTAYVRDIVADYLVSHDADASHSARRGTTSQPAGSSRVAGASFLRGAIAILAEIPAMLLAHPLRTISTRQQSKSTVGTSTGLWNGATLSVFAVLMSKIIFWFVYYLALAQLSSYSVVSTALRQGMLSFCASMIGGIAEAVIMHPLWVIVVRLQVYADGDTGMYDNLCDGLSFSLLLVLFPALRQFMFEYVLFVVDVLLLMHSTSFLQGTLGMGATIAATILTYPIQTMRTQVQTNSFDCGTLRPFAGLWAKLLASSVNAFSFFFFKKMLEALLL